MADGREVSLGETRLYNIERPIMGLARTYNALMSRKAYVTAGRLLCNIGIDISSLDDALTSKMNCKVSQVCRAGSRFEKGCICVQLYDDGYLAMKWAIEHGALFCITDKPYSGIPCLVVDSPTEIYAKLCRYYYEQNNSRVIAIAGSIGKTTTKRMIECVLREKYSTFSDPDNENQIDCVGYMCQHFPKGKELHIQEISEDTPNHISYISSMLNPEVAVITSIDQSHIEMFGSQEGIVKEIFDVCEGMAESGRIIINYDDCLARKHETIQSKTTVSIDNKNADVYADSIVVTNEGLRFNVVIGGSLQKGSISIKGAYARHNVLSALYAYTVGLGFQMTHEEILRGLLNYRTNGIRQNIIRTKNNIIYADCYNAVAKSIKSAIDAAEAIPIEGKIIAVLGDVEEAGEFSDSIHDEIISYINDSRVKVFFAYGEKTCNATERNQALFDDSVLVSVCRDKNGIVKGLKNVIQPGDLVIFKASRKSELETIIKAIWPKEYFASQVKRIWPIILWRIKMLFC